MSGDILGFIVKSGTGLQAGVRTPMQALDAAGSNLQLINSESQDVEARSRSDSRDGKSGTENNKGNGMGNREFRARNDQSAREGVGFHVELSPPSELSSLDRDLDTTLRSQKDTVSRDNSNKGIGSIMSGMNEGKERLRRSQLTPVLK